MHEFGTELDTAEEAVRSVDGRGPMTTPELVALWLDVEALLDLLSDVRRRLREDASDRVLGEAGEGAEYVSAAGDVVHLARGSSTTRWAGWELSGRLAVPVVVPATGEVMEAIPLEMVRRFVPGCADPELGSSSWRVTGLATVVPDWKRYRHKEPAPWVLRRGGKL